MVKSSTTNQNQSLSLLASQEIVFIDRGVYDYQSLVNGVKPGIAVVILNSKRDGIEQITEVLSQNQFSTVHIVSHGSPGCLYLGNSQLNLDNLNNYAQQLKDWFNFSPLSLPPSLSPSLLLYGCNVAAGEAGEEFIEKLHRLTAANIAASTTAIGNAQKGGNWELDINRGKVNSQSAFTVETIANYIGVLGIIYVKSDATGANSGNSWDDAYTDLQTALTNASSGDRIWVAKGTYKPTNTTDTSISFELKDGVAVYGGFAGTETDINQRNSKNNLTILSGDIGTLDDNTDNSYNVVKFSNNSGTTILDGFTIQDGNSNDDGGGIWNVGNLTLENIVVSNNQAADDGGGIRNDGNLTIINSTVADNTSIGDSDTSGGGGLINTNADGASVTIINSTFSGNKAKNGGGIRNDGNLNLINSTLSDNTASESGGGLVNTIDPNNPFDPTKGGKAIISNSTITKNTAEGTSNNGQASAVGSGLANFGITTVGNSIIADNSNSDDIVDLAFGITQSNGNNLIGNGEGTIFTDGDNGDIVGTSANPRDPQLGTLQDNGGLTQTHALLSGSLAINAGSNNNIALDTFDIDGDSNTTETLPFEQRGIGFERIIDSTVDIGAYEIKPVVEVSATTNNGSYNAGDTVEITVKFAKVVTVDTTNGIPQLTLETGANDRIAIYSSGSGTDTLSFIYTVEQQDESLDLDYISNSALQLNGGTIKDSNDSEVDLTLPNPGETDSLGANKDIIIDAIAPTVTNITASTSTISDSTTSFSLTVEYSEEMDISINPDINFPVENPNGTITFESGSWSNDNKFYTATYTVTDGNQESTDIDITVENGKDKIGNIQTSKTLNNVFSIDNQNPNPPSITSFTEDTDTVGDGITSDNTLIISGSAQANSEIEIFQDGNSIGKVTADNSGNWNFDYTSTTLANNSYAFTAVAKDGADNISTNSTAFNITVDAVNHAPVLDNTGDMTLNAINEDDIDNNGTLIQDIIFSGGGDRITDIDVNPVEGIAVTSVDNTNGNWQYSTDGINWNDFGTPNDTTARLLASGNLTKVRFLPNTEYEGTVINGITLRAWDTTTSNNGDTADTTNNGRNSAFSIQIETADITVNPVNDAPKVENNALTIDEGGSVTLSTTDISATDVDSEDTTLTFTVSNLQNGEFQINQVAQNSFTQQQINNGEVKFIHDGSENQPSYDLEVSDGEKSSDKSSVTVTFTNTNDAPTLKNEIIKIQAAQDIAFNFTLPADTFEDSDVGDTFTYKATLDDDSQLPSWLSFTNGTFTGTPTSDNLGDINIKVTATDKDGESVSDTFTLSVKKPNNPPIVDDAVFSIPENSEENTVVGIVTVNDSDNEALEFALAAGNLDLDKDGKLAFAINSETGEITVNDKDDIDFENTPSFNLQVTATDTGGLSDSADITINLTDVASAKFDINSSQNGIFSLDGGEKTNIKFTLTKTNIDASLVSEIAVFEVDENGNIDGFAPGSDDFIRAALSQSQLIFSAISNLPNGFAVEKIQRVLEVNSNARLEFLTISNGTIETALTEIESTGNTNLPIIFSTSDNLQINNLNSEGFNLKLESGIQVNAALTQENSVTATQLQTQKELIDLRDITGSAAVEVEVYREAAFDNLIGFYKITDVNGGIDIDGDGIADINPNDAGYKNAVLTNRITGLDLLSTENQQTATFNGNLEAGSILATFMIADGTFDEAINNDAEVYFSFLGANSDKTDHIRLLGDNTFGYEDMVNGGDGDFNDVVVKMNFSNG